MPEGTIHPVVMTPYEVVAIILAVIALIQPSLDWIEKSKVINRHQEVPFRVLENQYTYGADDSGNMIIHGYNRNWQGQTGKSQKSVVNRN